MFSSKSIELIGVTLEDAQHYNCLIVEVLGPALEERDGIEDRIHRSLGALGCGWMMLEQRAKAIGAKHLRLGVVRVNDAVRKEDNEISRLGNQGQLLIDNVRKEPKRKAFDLDRLDANGIRQAGRIGGHC